MARKDTFVVQINYCNIAKKEKTTFLSFIYASSLIFDIPKKQMWQCIIIKTGILQQNSFIYIFVRVSRHSLSPGNISYCVPTWYIQHGIAFEQLC